MDKETMRALIARELDRIPRGDIAQNVFRSLYQGMRESDLLEKNESEAPPGETFHKSVLWVQKIYPDFKPVVSDPGYFRVGENES